MYILISILRKYSSVGQKLIGAGMAAAILHQDCTALPGDICICIFLCICICITKVGSDKIALASLGTSVFASFFVFVFQC